MPTYSAGTTTTSPHTAVNRSTDTEVDLVVEPNVVAPYVLETASSVKIVVTASAGVYSPSTHSAGVRS